MKYSLRFGLAGSTGIGAGDGRTAADKSDDRLGEIPLGLSKPGLDKLLSIDHPI
jgi:hypothetical protein